MEEYDVVLQRQYENKYQDTYEGEMQTIIRDEEISKCLKVIEASGFITIKKNKNVYEISVNEIK